VRQTAATAVSGKLVSRVAAGYKATRPPVEASLAMLIGRVKITLNRKQSAVLTSFPSECRQPQPSIPAIHYVR
jgi:hypothetical protein